MMKIVFYFLRLVTFVAIAILTGMILMFALFIVVGFSLNAEYFNPFIASALALVLYFWENWKFSVEGRCLQLKSFIIEICKEKASGTEEGEDVHKSEGYIQSKNNRDLFRACCEFFRDYCDRFRHWCKTSLCCKTSKENIN
jgi:hypothetical protein